MKLGSKVFEELEKAVDFTFPESYKAFMSQYNGGYFKKGIFHMFSIGYKNNALDLFGWNQPTGWKRFYHEKAKRQGYNMSKILFFAENVEGDQFGFDLNSKAGNENSIVFMFASDGEIVKINDSFVDFMNRILPLEYTVAKDRFLPTVTYGKFQKEKGLVAPGNHLDTQSYQLLGIEPEMKIAPSEAHMASLGHVINQTLDLPEGQKAVLVFPDIDTTNTH